MLYNSRLTKETIEHLYFYQKTLYFDKLYDALFRYSEYVLHSQTLNYFKAQYSLSGNCSK